jgi:hypothetical protein
VTPLPDSRLGAQIPFYVVIGIWILLELRVRVRSRRNRQGTRLDHGTLLVVIVAIYGGLAAGFQLAGVRSAAIPDGRWLLRSTSGCIRSSVSSIAARTGGCGIRRTPA